MNRFIGAILLAVVVFLSNIPAVAQSVDQAADLIARVNRERLARGLTPYAVSAQLTAAAQAHANDIAASGNFGHVGSDGSTASVRAARKGFRAYSWGVRVGENWAWYHDVPTAMGMWMNSAPHRENILHPVYREMGVGVAKAKQGAFVYVIDFGSQPNVLPFFISDGASETRSANVVLTFSDEDSDRDGDGPNTIGTPREVQISNDAKFSGARWQAYAPKIPWTLASGSGLKTVYVRYRDARGRTAMATDSINLKTTAAPVPAISIATPRRASTATRTRTVTSTRTATRTPTRTLTRRPRPTATPTIAASPTAPDWPTEEPEPTPVPPTEVLEVAELETATPEVVWSALPTEPVPTAAVAGLAFTGEDPATSASQVILGAALTLGSISVFKWLGVRRKLGGR